MEPISEQDARNWRELIRPRQLESELGANGMNVRDVTFRIRGGEIEQDAPPDDEPADATADPDTNQVTE